MKRIKIFIIILLLICSITVNNVCADVGDPYAFFGDVVVSNKDGATGYIHKGRGEENEITTIPYGEVLEPQDMFGNEICVRYKNEYVYVNYHDIKPLEEYYYPENVDFENNYVEKVVLNDVFALYKGPALCYDKIEWVNIPKETVVKCVPADSPYWFYIEYEWAQGWIYLYEISDEEGLTHTPLIANVYNKTGIIYDGQEISYDRRLFSADPNNEKQILSNHDSGSQILIKYRFVLGRSIDYYIEGNNFSGWVDFDSIWIDADKENVYVTSDALDIYADDQYKNKLDTIKYDGELKVIRYQQTLYLGAIRHGGVYVEYDDGKEGFINCKENVVAIWAKDTSDKYPIYNEIGGYRLFNKPILSKENVITEIPKGDKINYQYMYRLEDMQPIWYHVDDGEYYGWIAYGEIEEEYIEQEKIQEDITIEEEVIEKEDTKETYNIFDVIKYGIIFALIIIVVICVFNDDIKKIINKIKHKS